MEESKLLGLLGLLLPGDALERIQDELTDGGAWLGHGDKALVGKALTELGARFTEDVKAAHVGATTAIDSREGDIIVKAVAPTSSWQVDSSAVKKFFPLADYPDLYKKQERRGYMTLELPVK